MTICEVANMSQRVKNNQKPIYHVLTFSGHNTVKIETNDLKPKSPVLWNLNTHLYDLESKNTQ